MLRVRLLQLCLPGEASADPGDQIHAPDDPGGPEKNEGRRQRMSGLMKVSSNPHIRDKASTDKIMGR